MSNSEMRGYFAVGIEGAKTKENVGTLMRTAHALGAAFIFTIGRRYPQQASDTTKAWRHIPLFEYADVDQFTAALPRDSEVIGVECAQRHPKPLTSFTHPERGVYVLGSEDRGMSGAMLDRCDRLVEIPNCSMCLNVATAGAIVMYDRCAKGAA